MLNINAYLALQESVFGEDTWPVVTRKMYYNPDYWHFFIADGQLLSAITFKINFDNTATIVLICTLEKHRSKGYACELLKRTIIFLKNKMIQKLTVEDYLESAKSWYMLKGFSEKDDKLEMLID